MIYAQEASLLCIKARTEKRELTKKEATRVKNLVGSSKQTLIHLLKGDENPSSPQIMQTLFILCTQFPSSINKKECEIFGINIHEDSEVENSVLKFGCQIAKQFEKEIFEEDKAPPAEDPLK